MAGRSAAVDEEAAPVDGEGSESPPPHEFSVGDQVLAEQGGRIYEAKGWSTTWDEWVDMTQLKKPSRLNVKKMHELNKSQNLEKNAKEWRATHMKSKPSNRVKCKKREHDSGAQLAKLPREPNVDEILKGYQEFMGKKHPITEGEKEMSQGLHDYFNKALPARLLYRNERQQYEEAVKDNVSPSTVYGAEHLLRLFVQLPEYLACVNMKEEALTRLQQSLHDLLK